MNVVTEENPEEVVRKKIFDDIVQQWNINVATSVVTDIHVSLQGGKDYLTSTIIRSIILNCIGHCTPLILI